jgi:hypothetical protein
MTRPQRDIVSCLANQLEANLAVFFCDTLFLSNSSKSCHWRALRSVCHSFRKPFRLARYLQLYKSEPGCGS